MNTKLIQSTPFYLMKNMDGFNTFKNFLMMNKGMKRLVKQLTENQKMTIELSLTESFSERVAFSDRYDDDIGICIMMYYTDGAGPLRGIIYGRRWKDTKIRRGKFVCMLRWGLDDVCYGRGLGTFVNDKIETLKIYKKYGDYYDYCYDNKIVIGPWEILTDDDSFFLDIEMYYDHSTGKYVKTKIGPSYISLGKAPPLLSDSEGSEEEEIEDEYHSEWYIATNQVMVKMWPWHLLLKWGHSLDVEQKECIDWEEVDPLTVWDKTDIIAYIISDSLFNLEAEL